MYGIVVQNEPPPFDASINPGKHPIIQWKTSSYNHDDHTALLLTDRQYRTVITSSDRPGSVSMLGDNRHEGVMWSGGVAIKASSYASTRYTSPSLQNMAWSLKSMITLCRAIT